MNIEKRKEENKEIEFTIILPTFNESRNVVPILEAVSSALKDFPYSYEILFVDDSSDDTPKVIRENIKKYSNIGLLHRSKSKRTGLATAFVAGFAKARGKYIFCMDSDLQHSPKEIVPMAKRIVEHTDDLVVGSRYIPGGSPEGLGGKYRIIISRFVTRFSAWILLPPTRKSTDPGAGMFVVRRDLIESVYFENLYGFKILIDILTRVPNARVSEHPIVFEKRANEESKATLKQGMYFFFHIFALFVFYRLPIIVKRILFIAACGLVGFLSFLAISYAETFFQKFLVTFSIFLTLQSSFMIFLTLYAWENPERMRKDGSPKKFIAPLKSFTIFIPARHEENVIADTIRSIATLNYPEEKKEILVLINRKDDAETIRIAQETIKEVGKPNIKLVDFDGPLGKAVGLNIGLKNATKDVVTIFDAEDEVHPEILNIINTTMFKERVDIVQSGVQLMNYNSNWYSLFNVMEYYFWFKSVLHFFAEKGMIPLGGNTVFFKRYWLEKIGGWDEKNLTEDADIGICMSVMGARTKVVYDERHSTREETPPTIGGFIKQRTRWNQGFIQVLFKGVWLKMSTMYQRFLALYILSWLFFQGFLFLILPMSILVAIFVKMPPVLGIIVNLPMYTLFILFVIMNIGAYQFIKSYSFKYSPLVILKITIFYIPFQMLLGVSAFRAMIRQFFGNISWEKTTHINTLRKEVSSNK